MDDMDKPVLTENELWEYLHCEQGLPVTRRSIKHAVLRRDRSDAVGKLQFLLEARWPGLDRVAEANRNVSSEVWCCPIKSPPRIWRAGGDYPNQMARNRRPNEGHYR